MRSIEYRKKSLLIAFAGLSISVLLTAACGAGKAGDAKSPGEPGTTDGATSAHSSVSASGASDGPTTTTALPDGGELQGAKLGSSTHTEVETKGEGGPKAGPKHVQEPGRTRQDIQTIIMARRDEARACYDKGLVDHPNIEGDLTIKWKIDPAGKVTDAAVDSSKSTIHEPSVGNCIVEIIKKISFAPSKGGFETRANYPFNFHPKTFGKGDAGTK